MFNLTFKNKLYLLFAILLILSFIADVFNLFELDRYSGLMAILFLTILICGIQYRAAKKGLDVMLSISRDYKVRKLWNIENQFDWEKVRKNQLKWAPICIGISLMQLFILFFTGNNYSLVLMIIAVINLFSYFILTRPIKYKGT